ncbi:MAG: hypothetical protein ABI811_05065 [Acidobacteriota bacterium]
MRLARADGAFRLQTPEGVEQAIALAPTNTSYLAFRALQLDYEGADPEPLLRRVGDLNPRSSAPRIRLALNAELRGDSAAAERLLLEAYSVDRQFETRWTLANYYLRQGRNDKFWTWIRNALEMSYGDRRPAFELCWRISPDGREILAKAIPDREPVVADYLAFILDRRDVDSVTPAALKLARSNSSSAALLNAAVDFLLDKLRGVDAMEVWEQMGLQAQGIGDPNMQRPGHGFAWREVAAEGVTHLVLDAPAGHRIRLSGKQPQSVELLRKFLPLRVGAHYRIRWESHTDGLPPESGLEWRFDGHTIAFEKNGFEMKASSDLSVLALVYVRPLGQVRAEGSVDLRNVAIEEIR